MLAAKPAAGQRPHPIILHLHRYQVKELLIREARRRGKLEYHGQLVRVVEDYSPEVLSQHAEYYEVLYSTQLQIPLPGGDKKWLCSAEEARRHIDSLPSPSSPS